MDAAVVSSGQARTEGPVWSAALGGRGAPRSRRERGGAPAVMVVLALTSVPILTVPMVALTMGSEPPWAVVPPVGLVLLVSVATPPVAADQPGCRAHGAA